MTVAVERARSATAKGTPSPNNVIYLGRDESATEETGLAVLSDRWIPFGSWRFYATAPMGADQGRIVRTREAIDVRFDHFLSPSIHMRDLRDGRISVALETFWPEGTVSMTGTIIHAADALHFADEDSDRVVELRKSTDGRLHLTMRQAGCIEEYSMVF